ncbi:MAG: hypothetical protein WA437_07090 [Candidatus Sulfotelmatobacter sp.]
MRFPEGSTIGGSDLFGMTVRRVALAGNLPYAKLVEENAFTPFVRP